MNVIPFFCIRIEFSPSLSACRSLHLLKVVMAIRNTVLKVFFRKTGENQLFLSLNDPHKPVSTHTISKWIVKTIKLAHTDKAVKVKAHQISYFLSDFVDPV
jgi:hypothetical protein